MNNKEIVSNLINKVQDTLTASEHATWEDLCVEMEIRDDSRPYDGIVVWGEEDDFGVKYYSVSLRKGYSETDLGTEIVKCFSDYFSLESLEKAVIDALLAAEMNHNNSISPKKETQNDRFLRINGKEFSFDKVAEALGLNPSPNREPVQVELCQRVDSGVLVAKGSFFDHDNYPGIDLELQLPPEKDTLPIMISRTEQPRPEGEEHPIRTYGYSRDDEYFMFFDSDLRSDAQVDEKPISPAITISGNRDYSVDVSCENPYVNYKGYSAPSLANSLEARIQSAASRSAENHSPEKDLKNQHSR